MAHELKRFYLFILKHSLEDQISLFKNGDKEEKDDIFTIQSKLFILSIFFIII